MKSLKLIPLLDSIPKVNSYSNYGNILEKIFKMNSLKYLIHSLKFKQDYLKQLTNETSNKINNNELYDVFDRKINQKHANICHSDSNLHILERARCTRIGHEG